MKTGATPVHRRANLAYRVEPEARSPGGGKDQGIHCDLQTHAAAHIHEHVHIREHKHVRTHRFKTNVTTIVSWSADVLTLWKKSTPWLEERKKRWSFNQKQFVV